MKSLMPFLILLMAFSSCASVRGVAGGSTTGEQVMLNVIYRAEALTEILSKCSAQNNFQRCTFAGPGPWGSFERMELHYQQIKPAEVERIVAALSEQPGVQQVTVRYANIIY